jgi:hypothetical protein
MCTLPKIAAVGQSRGRALLCQRKVAMNKEVGAFARIVARNCLTRLLISAPAAERRRPPTQRFLVVRRQASRSRDEFAPNMRRASRRRRFRREAVAGDGFS